MTKSVGYAAEAAKSALKPFQFERRDPGPNDVAIDIEFCGVCHSDLHQVRDEWGGSIFPMVPGHEIVGRVAWVGKDVKKFKVGDLGGRGLHGRLVLTYATELYIDGYIIRPGIPAFELERFQGGLCRFRRVPHRLRHHSSPAFLKSFANSSEY